MCGLAVEMENGSSIIDDVNDVMVAEVAYDAATGDDLQPSCSDVIKVRLFVVLILFVPVYLHCI